MQQQTEYSHSTRIPEKAIRGSKLNDTYAIWKQMPRKKAMSHKHPDQDPMKFVTSNNLPTTHKIHQKVKTNDVKGITLDEYFKARSQLELGHEITKINEQDEQQINKYYNQQFEEETIHKDIGTPEFGQLPEMRDKDKGTRRKSNNKQPFKAGKMKTQAYQPQQTTNKSKCKSKNKKHLPTSVDEEEEHIPMFESFYKINKKKEKQYDQKGNKKNKMLDKVEHQKERLIEIQASDMSFVTKHAGKFNINKNICRQLILDELRS